MRGLFTSILLILFLNHSFGQSDTTFQRQQKGFLFLSAHNYLYDYNGEEIKTLGFHDFFFPLVDYDSVVRSRNLVVIGDGIRLDYFKERQVLKSKAQKRYGKDTAGCYRFDSFYVLPVVVDLKAFKDYEPPICKKRYYIVKTKEGKEIWFAYFPTAGVITKVTLPPNKKDKTRSRRR